MTGSSLWLLPPKDHPLNKILTTLLHETIPARFPREAASSPRVVPHFFPAHITLTNGIVPESTYGTGEGSGAQAWLDSIPFPSSSSSTTDTAGGEGEGKGVKVRFEKVVSQDVFYRRCYVKVGFEGVKELAGVARAVGVLGEGVDVDAESGEVKFGEKTKEWLGSWQEEFGPHLSLMYGNEPVLDGAVREVRRVLEDAGLRLSESEIETVEGAGGFGGWDGGVIWLVPTDKPISEWGTPIATREL
ncbi:2',3'-cyclic-nucleotide 3'-phosphodiesterase [Chaetomium sp. MPI-SDFR-AT-0129]|nr:2',3'-cyclic-nucleotide 3'-phosphodiesterase [Chaetomium sp. MPI-SDFR-AT-0129]